LAQRQKFPRDTEGFAFFIRGGSENLMPLLLTDL